MAMDPSAVTSQDSSEIAPTLAMLVGSMMIPDPIMFTATMNVSWTRVIFFAVMPSSSLVTVAGPLLPVRVGVEVDAVIDSLLVDALHFVVEAGKPTEGLLKRHEVIEHRAPQPEFLFRVVEDPAAAGALRGPLPRRAGGATKSGSKMSPNCTRGSWPSSPAVSFRAAAVRQ